MPLFHFPPKFPPKTCFLFLLTKLFEFWSRYGFGVAHSLSLLCCADIADAASSTIRCMINKNVSKSNVYGKSESVSKTVVLETNKTNEKCLKIHSFLKQNLYFKKLMFSDI